jgi:hypothetical protein
MSIILRVDGLLGKITGTVYGGQVKVDCVTGLVHRTVQVFPLTSDFDKGFIQTPAGAHWTLSSAQDESQDRQDLQCPAVCRGVIDLDTAPVHHFLNVAQTQWVCCVPASAHQHDFQWIVQPFEHLAQLAGHRRLACLDHAVIVGYGLLR